MTSKWQKKSVPKIMSTDNSDKSIILLGTLAASRPFSRRTTGKSALSTAIPISFRINHAKEEVSILLKLRSTLFKNDTLSKAV